MEQRRPGGARGRRSCYSTTVALLGVAAGAVTAAKQRRPGGAHGRWSSSSTAAAFLGAVEQIRLLLLFLRSGASFSPTGSSPLLCTARHRWPPPSIQIRREEVRWRPDLTACGRLEPRRRAAAGRLAAAGGGVMGGGVMGGDRLSSLPDDLLGHILSLLPTQQAVRARQLSRRWRRVWPAHARALNVSVHDFPRRRSRLGAHARGALAQLLPALGGAGIPAISFELDRHADVASAWFREAMERASGSVRISVPRGVSRLDLPRCTRAESLDLRLNHLLDLELPSPAAAFGRLEELRLSMVVLPAGTPPLHEFLSASCPRLRALRLCCVRSRGDAVRRLALRSDALEVLDLNNVDGLEAVDVAAANLRLLSVRSCFRFYRDDGHGGGEETEVVVSAPSMWAVCWYRSYPKRLTFLTGMAHVRRLTGLKPGARAE